MTATATTVLPARALLLDMDGTLVNSDAAVERVWRRWADRHGLDGDEVMKVVHGRQGYASMALLLPDRPSGAEPPPTTRACSRRRPPTRRAWWRCRGRRSSWRRCAGCRTRW
ncbi:hypothetical protein SVIOM342S_07907 [Streptomyces violaceorubidus]